MKRLQERKKPLVENGFYYPKRWLGNLVVRLGADWHEVDCRGTWDDLKMDKKSLYFFTEIKNFAPTRRIFLPVETLLLLSRHRPAIEQG